MYLSLINQYWPSSGFEREEEAARSYDLATLKFWCRSAPLNFLVCLFIGDILEPQEPHHTRRSPNALSQGGTDRDAIERTKTSVFDKIRANLDDNEVDSIWT